MTDMEPIGSNICSAISYIEEEIDKCEAVIIGTPSPKSIIWKIRIFTINMLPNFIIENMNHERGTGVAVFFPVILSIVAMFILPSRINGYHIGQYLSAAPIIIILLGGIIFAGKKTERYYESKRQVHLLAPILADLKRLYEYDQNMNVGFKLDSQGNLDETTLKAMMKKREKEIREQG